MVFYLYAHESKTNGRYITVLQWIYVLYTFYLYIGYTPKATAPIPTIITTSRNPYLTYVNNVLTFALTRFEPLNSKGPSDRRRGSRYEQRKIDYVYVN